MIRKIPVLSIVMILFVLFLSACGKGNADVTKYVYKNPKQCQNFKIQKSIYEKDCLKVYFAPSGWRDDQSEISNVTCFTEDFGLFEEEYDYSYKKGVLTIHTEDAHEITGLEIHFPWYGVKLRYLKSSQFAGMVLEFVADIGEVEYGDEESYYTKEEMKAKEDRRNQRELRDKEAFSMLEGHWVSKENDITFDLGRHQHQATGYEYKFHDGSYAEGENGDYMDYIESFSYEYDEENDCYEISGSTGNMTAEIHFVLSGDKEILKIGFSDYADEEFLKEK